MSKYLRIGVSVVLLAIIAWRTNWTDVGAKFAQLNIGLWFAAVGVMVAALVASARRWQLFARELRFSQSLPQFCAYYFIGAYFNLLLPTSVGGDVMRVWYLNGDSGRKLAALASVFLERLNGLLVLFFVACFGILFTPVELPTWIHAAVWSVTGAALAGIIALPFLRSIDKLPEQRRRQLDTMLALMKHPRALASGTLISVFVQAMSVVCVWFLGMSIGLDVPVAYYCILAPMVGLLTLLPISVNGVGVREVGMIVFLAPLGVDEDSAKTLAFLWFAAGVIVSLLGGLVYLWGAQPRVQPDALTSEGADDDRPVAGNPDQGRAGQFKNAA